jgi:hypothetical protein
MELGIEKHLTRLWAVGFAAMIVHAMTLQRNSSNETEEEMEGYEGEFQLLGLS